MTRTKKLVELRRDYGTKAYQIFEFINDYVSDHNVFKGFTPNYNYAADRCLETLKAVNFNFRLAKSIMVVNRTWPR